MNKLDLSKTYKTLTILGCLLGGMIMSTAKATAQPADSESPKMELRFLFLDESPGAYYLKKEDTFSVLSDSPYKISPVIRPLTEELLEIYKELPNPEAPETMQRIQIGKLTASLEMGSSLIVLTPIKNMAADTSRPKYQVNVYGSDSNEFPKNSIRILNLSNAPFACEFNKDRQLIAPYSSNIIKPDTDSKNRLRYKVAARKAEGWELLDNGVMLLRADERVTGVLIYSPSGMRHTFSESEMEFFGEPKPGYYWLTYTD
ncbi:hypothetical protein [Coraliomargarita parva]|uniref:hypothetical protein n=1 Tax=Coraliomargarita parva TaxID=3014050 RepID=UPI0022B42ACA|nr:hypothetical protein [Coraliomargarita parva]